MKRIKLTVAYDGTNYSGWQIQPNAKTIEQVIDDAIKCVTGEDVHVMGASRTDAGVHAMGNVAVFDTASTIPGDRWSYAINRHLPEDVSVLESREVKAEFHPRHCNTRKVYEYRFITADFAIPQLRNQAWHIAAKLDVKAMNEAAQVLVGEHDFKSFCCVKTQAESTVRTVRSIEFYEQKDNDSYSTITMRITGDGFLYNMVRIIAGTLVNVGRGRLTAKGVCDMLERQDRCAAGQTAPPQGLTLMKVLYVDNDDASVNSCG